MGLYDYDGTLLINSQPARNYTRESLHAHTTVCFQDYVKYNSTLRENVGTGNYLRMDDEGLLEDALRKGGADAVVATLPKGLDEELDTTGDPSRGIEPRPVPRPRLTKGGKLPDPSTSTAGPLPQLVGIPVQTKRMLMTDVKSLSGGQWQRVALARAFMRSNEADLVVFECALHFDPYCIHPYKSQHSEPSASLDARAEHELFERIHSLSLSETGEKIKYGDHFKHALLQADEIPFLRTTIYVSHRFSTTRRADKIAVVEDGTIIELGPHDELMELNGRYAEFFNLQAKAFTD